MKRGFKLLLCNKEIEIFFIPLYLYSTFIQLSIDINVYLNRIVSLIPALLKLEPMKVE